MMMGSEHFGDDNVADPVARSRDYGYSSPARFSAVLHVSSWSSGPSSSSCSPARFIEHPVSKMDTLAGVAIKYGVEVADIKRINGLVTDLQMFALKTLRIPLPGRHPPSPCLSNDTNNAGPSMSVKNPSRRMHSDIFESFDSLKVTSDRKVSPAMSSLQGYYGLKPVRLTGRASSDGYEMAAYSKKNPYLIEDRLSTKSPGKNTPLGKSRSVANGFPYEEYETGKSSNLIAIDAYDNDSLDSDKLFENLVRRRQKPEGDYNPRTPEKLLKEENGVGGWFSAMAGKGLALRSNAISKNNLASEAESGSRPNGNLSPGHPAYAVSNGVSVVRKCSSTSCLPEQENNSGASLWPGSKWNLKPDLQALSSSVIAKPILNGFSNPIGGRKTKAALD